MLVFKSMDEDNNQGIIYIITGEGKGKTTAALGSALRASGWGKKVLIIQFCKPKDFETGEKRALEKIANIDIKQFGSCALWGKGLPSFPRSEEAKEKVQCALGFAYENQDKYDLLVLDEVFYAIEDGLIQKEALIGFLNQKPAELNLILTGRDVPSEVLEAADIVSDIGVRKYKRTRRNIKTIDY